LIWCLSALSKFAGMYIPGKESIISNIHIVKNRNLINDKDKFKFFYKKIKRTPLFENYLLYKEFDIKFISAIRPNFQIKKTPKPSVNLIKQIQKAKKNIFIIGASSGLGYELLKIFRYNKNIKILASYNKNKIDPNNKNLIKLKLDIEKDIKKIIKIVQKYQPLNVYYFASPKFIL
jgi:hypothetical protein